MSGFVPAHAELYRDGGVDIIPSVCPLAEHYHIEGTPRCYRLLFDGDRRCCPYWMRTTRVSNGSDLRDATELRTEMIGRAGAQVLCGVLCLAARRNRAPGC